jgi:hypothetical protein
MFLTNIFDTHNTFPSTKNTAAVNPLIVPHQIKYNNPHTFVGVPPTNPSHTHTPLTISAADK